MYTTLLVEIEKGICLVTINRPEKLNALNKTVFDELEKMLGQVYTDSSIQSVIITGAGAKAFVAGADISEFSGLTKEQGMAMAKRGQDIFFLIENSPKPIIAAINGFALGGGCELAMSCHFRLASENAKFGQPEVNLGLTPGYGGTQRLTQLVGKGRAIELLITANMIDAATALQIGLVNYVVPQEELINKAKAILEIVNSKGPIAVAGCIKAANAVFDEKENGYEMEVLEFGKCFNSEDMKEGVMAFMEKRKTVFKGK